MAPSSRAHPEARLRGVAVAGLSLGSISEPTNCANAGASPSAVVRPTPARRRREKAAKTMRRESSRIRNSKRLRRTLMSGVRLVRGRVRIPKDGQTSSLEGEEKAQRAHLNLLQSGAYHDATSSW